MLLLIKIRGDKTAKVQVLRDRILLGFMTIHGCRSIGMYRANLEDVRESYGQYFLKLDGKNSIRTVILRPDSGEEIARYRQARLKSGEKVNADRPYLRVPISFLELITISQNIILHSYCK